MVEAEAIPHRKLADLAWLPNSDQPTDGVLLHDELKGSVFHSYAFISNVCYSAALAALLML